MLPETNRDMTKQKYIINEAPKTHRIICPKCGKAFDFNADDILKEVDLTGAFPGVYVKRVRCMNIVGKRGARFVRCWALNVIESRDIDGNIKRADIVEL